jgi:hypothetical protein
MRCIAISKSGNSCRRYALAELDRPVCRLHATPEERERLRVEQDLERDRRLALWFLAGDGRASVLAERFASAVTAGGWDRAEQWARDAFLERDEALRLLAEDVQA